VKGRGGWTNPRIEYPQKRSGARGGECIAKLRTMQKTNIQWGLNKGKPRPHGGGENRTQKEWAAKVTANWRNDEKIDYKKNKNDPWAGNPIKRGTPRL